MKMTTTLRGVIAVAAALIMCNVGVKAAQSPALYTDGNWGVVPQNSGKLCMIIINSNDKSRAFHFLIDSEHNVARIEILEKFLPDRRYLTASKTTVAIDLGPQFVQPLEFKPFFDGVFHYIATDLRQSDLDSVLASLQSQTRGVSLSFENGVKWRLPPPRASHEAASAITQCWENAAKGMRFPYGPATRDDLAKVNSLIGGSTNDPTAFDLFMRGGGHAEKAEFDRAIEDYTQAIQLDPRFALAFHGRGRAYSAKGEYDLAIQDLDRALELSPNDADALEGRGFAYAQKKEYDRAIQDYDESIKLDPTTPGPFYNRGYIYRLKKQYDRAIEDFDKATALDSKLAVAWLERGTAYLSKGEYDRAIDNYDQAIKLNPNYDLAFNNRGTAYRRKRQYDRAIEDYDQAILLNPKLTLAYCQRARAKMASGDGPGAEQDFATASTMGNCIELEFPEAFGQR